MSTGEVEGRVLVVVVEFVVEVDDVPAVVVIPDLSQPIKVTRKRIAEANMTIFFMISPF